MKNNETCSILGVIIKINFMYPVPGTWVKLYFRFILQAYVETTFRISKKIVCGAHTKGDIECIEKKYKKS